MLYSTKFDEKDARAQAVALPISLKQSAEICRAIRNKKCDVALRILEQTIEMTACIPYSRFNRGVGHRTKTGPGRFPVKASKHILQVLKSVKANARQKGLDADSLTIKAAIAKQGPRTPRYGRHRGRTAKRTHIEIVACAEQIKKSVKKTGKKPAKAEIVKQAAGSATGIEKAVSQAEGRKTGGDKK